MLTKQKPKPLDPYCLQERIDADYHIMAKQRRAEELKKRVLLDDDFNTAEIITLPIIQSNNPPQPPTRPTIVEQEKQNLKEEDLTNNYPAKQIPVFALTKMQRIAYCYLWIVNIIFTPPSTTQKLLPPK